MSEYYDNDLNGIENEDEELEFDEEQEEEFKRR